MHHDQQQITAELARIARNGLPGLTADNAIISRLDALNLLINIHDDRGADATPLRQLLPAIADELLRLAADTQIGRASCRERV